MADTALPEKPVRNIPLGLSIVLIVLCIGGGAFLAYRQFKSHKSAGTLNVVGGSPAFNGKVVPLFERQNQKDKDGKDKEQQRRGVSAEAGKIHMIARYNARGTDPQPQVSYSALIIDETDLKDAQNKLNGLSRKLLEGGEADRTLARDHLNVSGDQLDKIRNLKNRPRWSGWPVPMTPEERKQLTASCSAWDKADKIGDDKRDGYANEILVQLATLGSKHMDEIKENARKHADEMAKILGPEQIAKIDSIPTAKKAPPPLKAAPAPAPAPAPTPTTTATPPPPAE